jgi:hypothetical protein
MYFGWLSQGTLEARFRSGSVVPSLGQARWFQQGLRSAGVCHSQPLVFIHSYKQYITLHVILKRVLRNLESDCQSSHITALGWRNSFEWGNNSNMYTMQEGKLKIKAY